MNRVVKYEYPSSSAEHWLSNGGTVPVGGSLSFPPTSSEIHVVYWKCPNCGSYLSEQTSNDSRNAPPSSC
jgi:hypothetical protein